MLYKYNLLALDTEPQHVLSVSNVWVLLDEICISGQQELPASVDPRRCHVLQELLHVLRGKLMEAEGRRT